MIRALLALAFLAGPSAAALSAGEVTNDEAQVDADVIHLRGLDNLNGISRDLEVRVGETLTFGQLEIHAEACRVPRDDPQGDAEAFLSIRDVREPTPRFSGWMFASSPALSALDHPRYDVWVVSCSIS
ncbi:MAG: DUF2155 domain-containing protein [Amaricoccus sp.]|uniref:DUF2155 domain-containing protein n=1 Tax=Amaricoccus sp. TaxID=1872485 RepID=UPI0039E41DBD